MLTTEADPSKQWIVKGATGAHPAIRIAEGGRSRSIQLVSPREADLQDQQKICDWRRNVLTTKTQAVGRDYCASLINMSEIVGPCTVGAPEANRCPDPTAKKRTRRKPKVPYADMGDVSAAEKELYATLLAANPHVGLDIIAKVENSYNKRLTVSNRVAMFPKLLEEIDRQRQDMASRKRWDKSTKEWKENVCEVARKNFGGTEEQWKIWCREILVPYADRFWEPGCDAPQIKDFKADIDPKTGARPSARRPFRLNEYDEARLEYRLDEFLESGQLYDAGEWASPAFIVDTVGDILGRVVTDYEGPNRETEDHPGEPADADQVLHKGAQKPFHTVMDMVWGFSQIELTDRAQRILAIVTKQGLKRWKYLPFGPKQGPGICQSFNEWTFGDLENTSVFVDDFHTANDTFEGHVKSIKALLPSPSRLDESPLFRHRHPVHLIWKSIYLKQRC